MKIIYINKTEEEQNSFRNAFQRHEVNCFHSLRDAYQYLKNDAIPDIMVTSADLRSSGDIDIIRIIRGKTIFRNMILLGYTNTGIREQKINNDIFLEVVNRDRIISLVFQLVQLFSGRHGKTGLAALYSRRSMIAKRMIDITVSSFALLLASPLMIAAAAAIKLEAPGPVFYRSKRVGSNYKIFDLLKFRTMVPGADKNLNNLSHLNLYSGSKESEEENTCPECSKLGTPCSPVIYDDKGAICENFFYAKQEMEKQGIFFKAKDDPRISKVGKFLRNTSIDELPQLINILRGDMSLVGNRPLPLYEAEKLTSDSRAFRFLAPAGLTGLWQVTKRGKKDMSEEERISLDNNYALNHSIWLDFKIIFKTFPALLQSESV